jgi:DNA polymerase III alpha subunit (gram-positive type)
MSETIFAVDLETTGLDLKKDKPCQIGLVYYVNGTSRVLMNTLVNPLTPISLEATTLNGITNKMVEHATDYAIQVWVVDMLFQAYSPDIILTYNGSQFDIPILNECIGREIFPRVKQLDLLDVMYRNYPTLQSFKLGSVYEKFVGHPLEEAHQAISDVNGLIYLLKAVLADLKTTATELADDLAIARPYTIFPISKNHKGKKLKEVPISFARRLLEQNPNGGMRPDLAASVEAILRPPV